MNEYLTPTRQYVTGTQLLKYKKPDFYHYQTYLNEIF